MKPRIFKCRCGVDHWVILVPSREIPNGGREPINAEFIDIRTYQNFLRAFNIGWRVRQEA